MCHISKLLGRSTVEPAASSGKGKWMAARSKLRRPAGLLDSPPHSGTRADAPEPVDLRTAQCAPPTKCPRLPGTQARTHQSQTGLLDANCVPRYKYQCFVVVSLTSITSELSGSNARSCPAHRRHTGFTHSDAAI